MLKIFTAGTKPSRILWIALLSVAGMLAGVLVIGTIYGIARSSDTPLFTLGNPARAEQADMAQAAYNDDIRVFSGLGRLRIPMPDSSILILSIAFPYPHNDIAFTEELAGKTGEFREIASGYFSSLPADKLIQIDEEAAKTEILKRYNAILRLGRIDALYFSDMMTIDAGQ